METLKVGEYNFCEKFKMSSNLGTGPLKMIGVEIEKPFLIGGSAQVDI